MHSKHSIAKVTAQKRGIKLVVPDLPAESQSDMQQTVYVTTHRETDIHHTAGCQHQLLSCFTNRTRRTISQTGE